MSWMNRLFRIKILNRILIKISFYRILISRLPSMHWSRD